MKILTSQNSIYFYGKIKDLKKELKKYQDQNLTLHDLIKLNLH